MTKVSLQARSTNDRILVVGDDPQALELLVSILEQEDYRLQLAGSSEQALVSMADQPPDLVLLDIRIPGMDGFEVCRRLKETEVGRRLPVLILSCTREQEEWVKGLALGAVDFIWKPFQKEELLARVRTHLELGRLQTRLETLVEQRTAELQNAIEQLQLEVAERRRAEEAASIADAAPVIIWTRDANNQNLFYNQYAQAFTGRTMSRNSGDAWIDLIHPEDRDRQQRESADAIAAQQGFQTEYRIRRAGGEYRWMLDRGTPRFHPGGELAGYVGVLVDLTEIRLSQERAIREKSLENLRVLAAGIAHDFNTMLAAIFGEVDLARSDMQEDSPGRENIDRIDTVAKRAAEVVRLLQAYVGDPSDSDRAELVNLTAVVQEIVPHLKAPVLNKAELRTQLAARLPWVRGDPLQMRLVVLNLIINAIEALEGAKGTVTVSTSQADIGDGLRGSQQPDLAAGLYIRLAVSDTGRGMPAEVRERVFAPYYTTKFLGRGLGLAAVQGIVRSYNGAIYARSVPGAGSTFEVLLPVAGTLTKNSEIPDRSQPTP